MDEAWLLSEQHPLASRYELELSDLRGCDIYLVPQGTLSPASDALRDAVAKAGLDITIRDYTDESAVFLAILSGTAVAVTRAGSGTLVPQGLKRVPMGPHGCSNDEGLVYRSADRQRIEPIIQAAVACFAGDS